MATEANLATTSGAALTVMLVAAALVVGPTTAVTSAPRIQLTTMLISPKATPHVGAPDVSDCSEHYGRWVNAFILNSMLRV
jgi:hypothetical protein